MRKRHTRQIRYLNKHDIVFKFDHFVKHYLYGNEWFFVISIGRTLLVHAILVVQKQISLEESNIKFVEVNLPVFLSKMDKNDNNNMAKMKALPLF